MPRAALLALVALMGVGAGCVGGRPDEPRSDERRLGGVNSEPGVGLFLGERHLRIVVTDSASRAIQRDFRAQGVDVTCTGSRVHSANARLRPGSDEAVARFPRPVPVDEEIVCGVETEETGTEAYGSTDRWDF